jgi:starvation-inducible DNA-binding protein
MSDAAVKPSREAIPVKTGLEREDCKGLAELLEKALADTYVLYAKTQGVHWNIIGPMFYGVHKLTQEQYEDMAESIDEIAERIRALGYLAPTKLSHLIQIADVQEVEDVNSALMVEMLAKDHQRVATSLREAVQEADKLDDVFTADLLTARIGKHEQYAWMLRALATKPTA